MFPEEETVNFYLNQWQPWLQRNAKVDVTRKNDFVEMRYGAVKATKIPIG